MPLDHLSADDRAKLDEELRACEKDTGSRTVRVLKDDGSVRVELVMDAAGRLHVRKSLPHDAAMLARYRRLADVHSLYLAHVEDSVEVDGHDVVVREYVPGTTLRTWVGAHGPVGDREALVLFGEMVRGVQALHEAKPSPIIHRDVNPDNIIVDDTDADSIRACLIDYSIVREKHEGMRADTQLLGTRPYAAPEQYGFRQTDTRSDVFSLGLVLVFMLTGSDPRFGAAGELEGIDSLSAPVRAIVRRCTSFDPDARYRNASELLVVVSIAVTGLPAGSATGGSMGHDQARGDKAAKASHAAGGISRAKGDAGFKVADSAGKQSAKPGFAFTRGSGIGRVLWVVWRIVATATVALTIAACVTLVVSPRAGSTNSPGMNLAIGIAWMLFVVFPVYVLVCDWGGVWDRVLKPHPIRRTVAILVGGAFALVLCAIIASACGL